VSADRDARARKVARLYASGLSVRQAAVKAGIHHQTALDDLRRLDDGFYGPGPWRRRLDRRHAAARDKRMNTAVQLRAQGMSLRQIAGDLGVSYQTVANDLARWKREHPNVISLVPKPSRNGGRNCPPGGQEETPEVDTRRTASRSGAANSPPGGQDYAPEVDR
jgi:transposase